MFIIPKDVSKTIYSFYQKLKGNSELFSYLENLKMTQFYTPEKIKSLQWEKLKKLLIYSGANCLYYKKLFKKNNINIADINTYNDFLRIPLLDKKEVRENFFSIISNKFDKNQLLLNHSSGSTGQPLAFYQTKEFKLMAKAHQLRNYEWCGYEIGDKFALLWGSEIYFNSKFFFDKLENYLYNRLEFNTFCLTEDVLKRYALRLSKFSPKLISTYVSSIYLIGQIVKKYNLPQIKVGAIQTTSEVISDFQRSFIKKNFGVDIFDKYGSRETNVIAHECIKHNGLHINSENVFVEFLRDNKPVKEGEVGEVVVTNLNNYGMPLIRYRMHDLARPLSNCDCGLGLPKMSHVIGRRSDMIVTADGGFVDSYLFSYILMRFENIKAFQIVQDTLNKLRIRLIVKEKPDEGFEIEISKLINKFAGKNFRIKFEYVEQISPLSSGKYRLTISHVKTSMVKKV